MLTYDEWYETYHGNTQQWQEYATNQATKEAQKEAQRLFKERAPQREKDRIETLDSLRE